MTALQKLVLWISILASFIAFLDGSVVNVALPAIADEFGGGLSVQQWVVDAYLIILGALMLIAGSLSDLLGRKKVLLAGLIGFGFASVLCAVAPSATFLIIARALQGAAGALLVPSSLALIMSSFEPDKKGKAIGLWTAWTGTAIIAGPLLGGLLVDFSSWRFIFAINILPIAAALWLLAKLETPLVEAHSSLDIRGALLGILGLGAPVYALIEQPHLGWGNPIVSIFLIFGLITMVTFIFYERRIRDPMLPLGLFRTRNFSIGNVATLAIYAGLASASFLVTVFVQQVGGYSATAAGLCLMPVTLIMFLLSPKFGALADKHGPRLFMAVGPVIAGLGFITMLSVDQSVQYWTQILPGVLLFGLGLAATVAPLTSAILGSIETEHAGVASAVNNAVSRIAGLLAVAFIGVLAAGKLDLVAFHRGLLLTSVLLFIGGIVSAFGIQNPDKHLHKNRHPLQ